MPLYEYQCPKCNTTRDIRITFADLERTVVVCPNFKCGAQMKRAIPRINFIIRKKEGKDNG